MRSFLSTRCSRRPRDSKWNKANCGVSSEVIQSHIVAIITSPAERFSARLGISPELSHELLQFNSVPQESVERAKHSIKIATAIPPAQVRMLASQCILLEHRVWSLSL